MASQSQMLEALHRANPSTLNQRYTPAQLQAAFQALGQRRGRAAQPQAPVAPAPSNYPQVGLPEEANRFGNTALNNFENSGLGESFTPAAAESNLGGTDLNNAFKPELTARETTGTLSGDRARVEDALFNSLTRRSDQQYQQDKAQLAQQLHDEGIQFSSDPNSAYAQRMKALTDPYLDQRTNAGIQASIYGGQELERQFGMGEQLRSDQLNEQTGTRNQQLNEALGLQGYAQNNRNQQLNEVSTLTGLQELLKELQMKQKLLPAQIQALNRSNRGGGGAAPPEDTSPFISSGPPGL